MAWRFCIGNIFVDSFRYNESVLIRNTVVNGGILDGLVQNATQGSIDK